MSINCLEDRMYDFVNNGNVEGAMDLLKMGLNVNSLHSSGRTFLGRAAHLGDSGMVCLLLDAEKFYSTNEEESNLESNNSHFCSHECSKYWPSNEAQESSTTLIKTSKDVDSHAIHKCCSPSIDSETYNYSDEVWGHDASDTNAGQHSDLEGSANKLEGCNAAKNISGSEICPVPKEEPKKHEDVILPLCGATSAAPYSTISPYSSSSKLSSTNIGYFVYKYREEDEQDTEYSSGPVASSTEDSDSAACEKKQPILPVPFRYSSILLHRTLIQGRASNIVSSDSEFETENYRRRRHAKHYHHRHHRHYKEQVRHKVLMSSNASSSQFFAHLHKEYVSLGLSSPWSLRHSCDINLYDIYGRTALHYASEQGHAYIVQVLITAGCKVDAPDADHMTALHLATQRGMKEIITLLIDGGAKVNSKMNDKSSPLHIAASRGYTDIVEMLLDRGAKIDSLDSSDRTALLLAVSRAHHKVVQLLLKRGAKVNIEEIHGYTPLCEAVWQRDVRVVQMLLKASAKVTQTHYLLHYAVLHRSYQLVELLLGARCIVNLRDDSGDTPLIIACRTCQPIIIKLLLTHGASANYPNGVTGSRPLHEAVEGTRDAQHEDFQIVFNLLYRHGAKLDEETLLTGDTPLYRAFLLKKNKAAALLIRHGCDVNLQPPVDSVDFLKMVAVRGHTSLANLTILAGFSFSKTLWLSGTYQPGTLFAHLMHIKSRPLSLADQCRISIRRRFGCTVIKKIQDLKLPPRLKQFLLLLDAPEVDL